MPANCDMLFNHESLLQGQGFVTRTVTTQLTKALVGKPFAMEVGDLNTRRDGGFAGDYAEGRWRMLRRRQGDDFVLATEETCSVGAFRDPAAHHTGHEIAWDLVGTLDGRTREMGQEVVRMNRKFSRSPEVDLLIGDPAKVNHHVDMKATIRFEGLFEMMMSADMHRVADGTIAS
jgi:GDPmannose 4,6-dehydratase